MDANIKLFIIDADQSFRSQLKQLIDSEPDIEIIGQAGNSETAIDQLRTLHPDVIIMAVRLPGADGIEIARKLLLREPQTRILFLTGYDNPDVVVKALETGARGYLLKGADNKVVVNAIRQVNQGKYFFIGEVTDVLIRRYLELQKAAVTGEIALSKREQQILRLINRRLSNKEIAEALRVSVRTIEAHRLNILRKFQAGNMEEVLARLDPDIDPLSVKGPGK